nr:GIY-YIG nuclease family protein [Pedobacter mongoliensis]
MHVPRESGCYVLTAFDGTILYIGLALKLNIRFKQHVDSLGKVKPTGDGKAVWFYYLGYNEKNLPKLERTWLNHFQSYEGKLPILNLINSPLG